MLGLHSIVLIRGIFFLAAALYYLAELVEEYTSTAAKVLRYWIWVSDFIVAQYIAY